MMSEVPADNGSSKDPAWGRPKSNGASHRMSFNTMVFRMFVNQQAINKLCSRRRSNALCCDSSAVSQVTQYNDLS